MRHTNLLLGIRAADNSAEFAVHWVMRDQMRL